MRPFVLTVGLFLAAALDLLHRSITTRGSVTMGKIFLAGLAVALVCGGCASTPSPSCGPASCSGCCDPAGSCQPGASIDGCGRGGLACNVCVASQGQSCVNNACAFVELPLPDAGPAIDGGADAGLDGGMDAGPVPGAALGFPQSAVGPPAPIVKLSVAIRLPP